MVPRVALDTSALMMPVELDVRLFDELDRLLTDPQSGPETVSSGDRGSLNDSRTTNPREHDDARADAFEPVVPQPVVEELRRIGEKGGTEGTAASVGHDLAIERCFVVDTEASYADDALVELARESVVDYVVTNDRPLRERVLEANRPVIALRGRNKLAVTQP